MDRNTRRMLEKSNAQWPEQLKEVPRAAWPAELFDTESSVRARVYRSREFLVQVYLDQDKFVRLSINRTTIDGKSGRFADGITWDQLQRLKGEAGFAGNWAVEVYPTEDNVVDVANMRHLWILGAPPPFAWQPSQG